MRFKKFFMNLPLIEYLFRRELRGKTVLLLVMILALTGGFIGVGCIRGLQPIGWSGTVVVDGTLFVGTKEGRLVEVNVADGSRQWSEPLKMPASGGLGCAGPTAGGGCAAQPSGVAIYGTPAVAGELVYIGGYNGKIYAFNSDSLAVRWIYPREGYLKAIIGGPLVMSDRVYFSTSDGKVYALDAATGDKEWELQIGDKIWSTPAGDGDTIYIGSFDHKLYALDAESGRERWDFEAQGAMASTPLVYDNKVYVGSLDRYLYAVDAADGRQAWKFMGESWFWAKPVAYNDVIYAPCLDGKVYILDAERGVEVAEAVDLGSPISSSPVLVGDEVIVASQAGMIYALDTGSNEGRQLTSIEKEVYSPLGAGGGIVYIHTQDSTINPVDASTGGKLAAISLKSGE